MKFVMSGDFDVRQSMYPSYASLLVSEQKRFGFPYSTLYCYADGNVTLKVTDSEPICLVKGNYLSLPLQENNIEIETDGKAFCVWRLGFQGQYVLGKLEEKGRLSYIDGCSDSLLVYPPRLGDPSLNSLHFPDCIDQSFHRHPTIRLGYVVSGSGCAWISRSDVVDLNAGTMFLLDEQALHRFTTDHEPMIIVTYHPDGDWGPTDHNHTMLNRTYVSK